MAGFIPAHPRDLTPAWVTSAMREAGALVAGEVASVSVEPLVDGGTGFTGETVRVRLGYARGAQGPDTAIAKFATSDHQNRGMLEQFDAYAREIRFYQRFSHRVPCAIPGYLGADYDADGARATGPRTARLIDRLPDRVQLLITRDVTKFMRATKRRYALLLEDLGRETTVHDMVAPPDEARLREALDSLARLHAGFWHDPTLAGDDVFRRLLTPTPGLYRTVGLRRCLPMAAQRWGWLDEDHLTVLNDALDRFAADVALVNTPVTLVHGDPRADNLLFRRRGGAEGADDADVVLLDWGLAGHAHPGFDVGYLLSSCVTAARVGEIEGLLDHYRATLAAGGADLDRAELHEVVAATYRAMAVQQLMSVAVLHGGYGDQHLADIWMPRALAGIEVLSRRVVRGG